MDSVADLITEESLRKLATPADLRLGQEIATQGGVELVETNPLKVVAKVQPRGGQKRMVELFSTNQGVKCKCT